MKQTAIEWLIEQMKKGEVAYGMFHVLGQIEIFEQARQMEEEQIKGDYRQGRKDGWEFASYAGGDFNDKDDYFNKIYKKQIL